MALPTFRLLRAGTRQARLIVSSPVGAQQPAGRIIRCYTAPVNDLKFIINEVHDFDKHYADVFPGQEGVNQETLDMVLSEVAKFCENELGPLNEIGDQEGCTWKDEQTVTTPTGYKAAHDQYVEGGWQGLSMPEEYGGQGLPY